MSGDSKSVMMFLAGAGIVLVGVGGAFYAYKHMNTPKPASSSTPEVALSPNFTIYDPYVRYPLRYDWGRGYPTGPWDRRLPRHRAPFRHP